MQHSIGYAGRAAQPLYDAALAVKKRQQPQNGPKGKGILQSLLPTSPVALLKPQKSMAIKQPDNIVLSGNAHHPSIPPAAMSAVSFSGYLEGPLNLRVQPPTVQSAQVLLSGCQIPLWQKWQLLVLMVQVLRMSQTIYASYAGMQKGKQSWHPAATLLCASE